MVSLIIIESPDIFRAVSPPAWEGELPNGQTFEAEGTRRRQDLCYSLVGCLFELPCDLLSHMQQGSVKPDDAN